VAQFTQGFKDFNWDQDGATSYKELAERVVDNYEVDQKGEGLNKVEFGYMIAELIGKYEDNSDEECEHCL